MVQTQEDKKIQREGKTKTRRDKIRNKNNKRHVSESERQEHKKDKDKAGKDKTRRDKIRDKKNKRSEMSFEKVSSKRDKIT